MYDIAASPDLFVVVSEQVSHRYGNPGVWTSRDGVEWNRVPPDRLPFRDQSHGLGFVEWTGDLFIGTGMAVPRISLSIDGREWFDVEGFGAAHPEVSLPEAAVLGVGRYGRLYGAIGDRVARLQFAPQPARTAAGAGGAFLVLGYGGVGLSADGDDWTWIPVEDLERVGLPFTEEPADVVGWRGGLVVAGPGEKGGAVWVWEPSE
jgi:hypothetical protein